jgi:drug/metabolite transporter (DMT)-like permease
MTRQTKATAIGFCAILLWSSIVGLIKEVSHSFGATAGAALIYTTKWVPLYKFPLRYLLWGALLMVSYELCLALSIGYSQNSKQAIEVGMVNYLWPTFTMIATVLFTPRKASWLIFPGIVISMAGIIWVLGGESGFDMLEMFANIKANPLSYGLAFLGALLWAAYCVVTILISRGTNGITFFFILVAAVLWIKYLILGDPVEMHFNFSSSLYLLMAAAAMGFGYAAWNVGILHGNVTALAGASYFTPVLSSALSSALLSTSLGLSFWQGAFMVCLGSVLCWLSTRKAIDKETKLNNTND